MKKLFPVVLCFLLLAFFIQHVSAQNQKKVSWKKVKVLVYTKNGKGYVHKNIPSAVKAIQKLGSEKGFQVEVSDDPSVMTEANLKQYSFLLFPSTNNDVFDSDAQRVAFRRYIEAGGGFVGLHSVTGTERNWTWFKRMIGGSFVWHAKFQPFSIKIIDKDHPSMEGVPALWTKEDECYFTKEMYPGIKVLMAHDISTVKGNEADQEKIKTLAVQFPDYYPAVWQQKFDGGTIWITTLGHADKDYEDPVYLNHIFRGMTFVASNVGNLDFSKSYATERDTPLR
ncbi:MAG: ThuA domain-containing protein [Cyclobacteriaceae bacterium]